MEKGLYAVAGAQPARARPGGDRSWRFPAGKYDPAPRTSRACWRCSTGNLPTIGHPLPPTSPTIACPITSSRIFRALAGCATSTMPPPAFQAKRTYIGYLLRPHRPQRDRASALFHRLFAVSHRSYPAGRRPAARCKRPPPVQTRWRSAGLRRPPPTRPGWQPAAMAGNELGNGGIDIHRPASIFQSTRQSVVTNSRRREPAHGSSRHRLDRPHRRSARPIAAPSTTPTAPTLAGHAIAAAVARAGVEPAARSRTWCSAAALQQGATGLNVARQCALRAGLPATVAGMTIDRQCASGLLAIAIAAQQIDRRRHADHGRRRRRIDHAGAERAHEPLPRARSPGSCAHKPRLYMPMIETAEIVARALRHQPRGAGRLRAAKPAAHRRRPGGRPLRRRDRAAATSRWTSPTRRRARSASRAGDAVEGRGQPAGHHARRASRR